MVVCHYYLQGKCKYGQNCRFEHPLPTQESPLTIDNKIYHDVLVDIIAAEKGGQWPLSCFAPFKDGPMLPKLDDTAPEELRWYYYAAKKDGRPNDYLAHSANLFKQAQDMRMFIKEPSLEVARLMEDLKTKKGTNQHQGLAAISSQETAAKGSIFGGNSGSSGTFAATRPPEQTSIFGGSASTSSPFTNQPTQSSSPSIFGGNQSVFGAPQSSTPSDGSQTSSKSIFGGTPSTNIFASVPPPPNFQSAASGSSIFQSQSTGYSGASPFATAPPTSNVFGGNAGQTMFGGTALSDSKPLFNEPVKEVAENNENLYSILEELSEEDKESYLAPTFSFGKIPLKPPPKSLC